MRSMASVLAPYIGSPKPQRLVLINGLFDEVGPAAAPFLGPMQRHVAGLMEPAMVFKQAPPALITIGTRVEIVAGAKHFLFGALQERADSAAEFFLLRGIVEVHNQPRRIVAWRAPSNGACDVSTGSGQTVVGDSMGMQMGRDFQSRWPGIARDGPKRM